MKTSIILLLFLPFSMLAEDPVTISPEQPVMNEEVTIYYDPSADRAVLRDPDSIDLYTLYWYAGGDPVFHSYSMQESEGIWKTSLTLDDHELRAVQFKFKSGEHTDNNNDVFWHFPLYDNDRTVLPDGYYALGRSWMPLLIIWIPELEMFREMMPTRAEKYFVKELDLTPGHIEATTNYFLSIYLQLHETKDSDEIKERGLETAKNLHENFPDNPDILAAIVQAYKLLGESGKATELQNYIFENYPDHNSIKKFKADEIFQVRGDKEKSVELSRIFLQQYPDAEQAKVIAASVFLYNLIALGEYDEAIEWIGSHPDPTPYLFSLVANGMLGMGVEPERIIPIAKKSVELYEMQLPHEKPDYMTDTDWERNKATYLYMQYILPPLNFYHTYATALWNNRDSEAALDQIQKAYEMPDGKNFFVYYRYVEILNFAGKYEQALKLGREAIFLNEADSELINLLQKSFTHIYDTEEGFSDYINQAKSEGKQSLYEKFMAGMMQDPAPDFTIDQLNGDPITLSELEGKVVVLDFWATWCGPCISAFPHFQRVVEHFEDNPDVVFLAINTWEGDYDEERIENARNFIEENEYTFSVLFDEDTVVSEYGVQGIPTRFTLDRDGVIRFEDRGFSGPGMYNDMVVQIEMLLEGYEPDLNP